MKYYDKTEAVEVLTGIIFNYDKRTIAKEFAKLAVRCLRNDETHTYNEFDGIKISMQNGKYAVKLMGEE